MNIELRFYSRSGNTKKVADEISKELSIRPYTIDREISENVDKLFLGGAIYAGNYSKNLRTYIDELPADKIRKVYVFSTCGFNRNPYEKMKKQLNDKGIEVSEINFFCKGRKVNDKDIIEKMKDFANAAYNE